MNTTLILCKPTIWMDNSCCCYNLMSTMFSSNPSIWDYSYVFQIHFFEIYQGKYCNGFLRDCLIEHRATPSPPPHPPGYGHHPKVWRFIPPVLTVLSFFFLYWFLSLILSFFWSFFAFF